MRLPKEWPLVELHPDHQIFLWLADVVSSAIPPQGYHPDRIRAIEILERGLGATSIRHPLNQEFVLNYLDDYFRGRAEGLQMRFDKPGKGDKSGKRGKRGRKFTKGH